MPKGFKQPPLSPGYAAEQVSAYVGEQQKKIHPQLKIKQDEKIKRAIQWKIAGKAFWKRRTVTW